MRRSPIVAVLLALLVVVAGCGGGDDEDTSSSTTAAQAVPTEGGEGLEVCAPLAALVGIFVDHPDLATGSAEGRAAADSTLTTALEQVEEAEPEPTPEVADAIETLRDLSFVEPESPSGPVTDEANTAVSTLTHELGGPCGDLGG